MEASAVWIRSRIPARKSGWSSTISTATWSSRAMTVFTCHPSRAVLRSVRRRSVPSDGTPLRAWAPCHGPGAANWDLAEKPEIVLGGGVINPSSLDLVAGQPYQISITNTDSVDLGIGMQDFFRASAVRKTESGAEIKLILFKGVYVKAGQTIELFVVPVMPGTYDLTGLAADGTPVDGMTGTANVSGDVPTAPQPVIEDVSTVGVPEGAADMLAAAIPTWDATAIAVTITMGDTEEAHFFEPSDTVLKVGVPATITFVNAGTTMHVYEMADFLKTAVLKQVTGTGGWNTGGLAKPADVEAGVTTSLSIIPTQAGTFELTDSAPGMESMRATITVTE